MNFRLIAIVMAMAALTPGAAQARTRDDVMSGAFRCAMIGDGRQWLDCYYGAAQPLRAQLALPPASQAQIRLAAAPPTGGALPADQGLARDTVMSEAFRCTAIENDRQWLDCFYAAAQPMRALLGLSPAPQAQAGMTAVPAVRAQSGGQFGSAAPAPPKTADHIVSRMAAFKFDQYGVFTMTLANGQVWRQIDGDTSHVTLKPPAEKYTVTIKHGFFGSYNLTIAGIAGLFRVLRIA